MSGFPVPLTGSMAFIWRIVLGLVGPLGVFPWYNLPLTVNCERKPCAATCGAARKSEIRNALVKAAFMSEKMNGLE
jgi:hypothetical protein